ncbi:MAG: hypothetical protein AB7U73_04900 [Pirellulales bacterium]
MARVNNRRRAPYRNSRRGFLSFEWILLISLLVIGVIGGLSAVRDALILELKDVADCVRALNVTGNASSDTTSAPVVFDPSQGFDPNSFPTP